MESLLVRTAAERLGVPTERVFGLSFEWNETPCHKKVIIKAFTDWYFTGKIHPVVEDFVIDVLSGRVQPKKLLK